MRCAIDSHLLVSSLFKIHSTLALVLAAGRMRKFEWVTCQEQISEMSVALFRPKVIDRAVGGLLMAEQLFAELQESVRIISLVHPLPAICRNPFDDFLFAFFDQGHIDMIVSGDLDVLAMKGRYPVLTARELIDRL